VFAQPGHEKTSKKKIISLCQFPTEIHYFKQKKLKTGRERTNSKKSYCLIKRKFLFFNLNIGLLKKSYDIFRKSRKGNTTYYWVLTVGRSAAVTTGEVAATLEKSTK
jgi:hypothetical protein